MLLIFLCLVTAALASLSTAVAFWVWHAYRVRHLYETNRELDEELRRMSRELAWRSGLPLSSEV